MSAQWGFSKCISFHLNEFCFFHSFPHLPLFIILSQWWSFILNWPLTDTNNEGKFCCFVFSFILCFSFLVLFLFLLEFTWLLNKFSFLVWVIKENEPFSILDSNKIYFYIKKRMWKDHLKILFFFVWCFTFIIFYLFIFILLIPLIYRTFLELYRG